ncbi:MAG: hypothetical protein DRP16_02490 [Candidatus Aenigmatarchaeota archaeon]|nr:MAG: hypothetical protein DRP16_02490 [Candidatus Aenigmarchaeota archaeon]
MKKGFIYIVEIIVIGLFVFVAMLQFTYLPYIDSSWEYTKLKMQANDLVFFLEKNRTDWFNSTQVSSVLSHFLPSSILYSLRIENTIKPRIVVGCLCNDSEFNDLQDILTNVTLNRPVRFVLDQIDPDNPAFSHIYDVVFLKNRALGNYYSRIRSYLGDDKGIVEFRTFKQSEIDSVQSDFFNLVWNNSLSPNSNDVVFSDTADPENRFYTVKKLFYHIPVFTEDFENGASDWIASGDWNVNNGWYEGYNDTGPDNFSKSYYNEWFSGPYTLSGDFYIFNELGLGKNAVFFVGYRNENNYIRVRFDNVSGKIGVEEIVSGAINNLGSVNYPVNHSVWNRIEIYLGNRVKVYINKSLVLTSLPVSFEPSLNSRVGVGVDYGKTGFDNISLRYGKEKTFQGFSLTKVYPKDDRKEKIILLQNVTSVPVCILNQHIVDGSGRTAWLSGGVETNEIKTLIKSLIVWAAGNKYTVIDNELKKPASAALFKSFSENMPETVKIVLTLGYAF